MTRAEFIDRVQAMIEEVQLHAWGVMDDATERSPEQVAQSIAALVPDSAFDKGSGHLSLMEK